MSATDETKGAREMRGQTNLSERVVMTLVYFFYRLNKNVFVVQTVIIKKNPNTYMYTPHTVGRINDFFRE